jgi:DNA-directed RNA polymerase specialized sigma24 family protein
MSGTQSTATRLDHMLYAWLAEADDRKFNRAFEKYHAEAFSGLVKYLSRRSSSVELDFEQIAADALLKFFSKVGRERRAAADLVAHLLPRIRDFDFGPFHVRQVGRWTTDVGSFRESALSFQLIEQTADLDWKAEIQSLTHRIPPLQRQGCHLLEPVRAAAGLDGSANTATSKATADDDVEQATYGEFVRRLSEAGADPTSARTVEHRCPGSLRFVDGTWRIIDSMPLLRVPSNGYLFDMAQSLYLDECKARGRQKRGGSGGSIYDDHSHPVMQMDTDEEAPHDEAGAGAALTLSLAGDVADPSSDTEAELAGEEFCEKFYAYLRRPLAAAEEAYRVASATGPAKAELKRLESLAGKIERMITILTMRIEGQTQEAIADTLDISRNQVKYVVELVQASYEQFAAACTRQGLRPAAVGASAPLS